MSKLKYVILTLIAVPVLLVLLWSFAVPVDIIKKIIEDAAAGSGSGNISLSIEGLRKGLLFSLYADTVDLNIDDRPALRITGFEGHATPRYLQDGQLAAEISGRIGSGNVKGMVRLPLRGRISIDNAGLDAVPYLKRFNIGLRGSVSSDISLKDNVINVVFKVPDLFIDDTSSVIPLLSTFRSLQGSLSVEGDTIKINSISLDGDKGYARLKGGITNNIMDLSLELMPAADRLNTMESMLIGKYIVSPGYYVVPVKGPLPK